MLLIPLDNFFVPFDAVAMHEFGHALGFAHEFARPDFTAPPETCPNVDINDEFHAGSGDTLDTPPDVQSILVSGYCGPIPEISYWDVVGSQHAYGFPNYFSDTDGDGRTDAIVVDPTAIRVKTSNGAQFTSQPPWTSGAFSGHKGTFFADVDGDGKADAVAVNSDGIYVQRSTGSGFTSPPVKWSDRAFYGERWLLFADVDGDHRADAIAVNGAGVRVRLSNGVAFQGPGTVWGKFNVGDQLLGVFSVDVAGEERADIVEIYVNGTFVNVSRGTFFNRVRALWSSSFHGERGTALADVDGDGKADLIAVRDDGIWVRKSNGTGFSDPALNLSGGAFYGTRGTFFADTNGDGRADAIAVNDSGVLVRTSTGSAFPATTESNWTGASFYGSRDAACVDQVQQGDETDLDCGGSCVPCALGRHCLVPTDCADGTCSGGVCTAVSSCQNGIKDGDETDTDCGGSCGACPYPLPIDAAEDLITPLMAAINPSGANIALRPVGSGEVEASLVGGLQGIAGMSRNLSASTISAHSDWASDVDNVIGIDAVLLLAHSSAQCFNDPESSEHWMRLILGGVDGSGSRDACSHKARVDAIAAFGACLGTYKITHVYRPDDRSGTSAFMLSALGISGFCNNDQGQSQGPLNIDDADNDPIRTVCAPGGLSATPCRPDGTLGLLVALSEPDPGSSNVEVSIAQRVAGDTATKTTVGYASRQTKYGTSILGLRALRIDGRNPTASNVRVGFYPWSHPLFIHSADLTQSAITTADPTGEQQKLLAWATGIGADPVKNPSCSAVRATGPPTGVPADGAPLPAQSMVREWPTVNHAPLTAAIHAPSNAIGRSELASTIRPPIRVPMPGSISSHSRPVVYVQALSGV